MANRITAKNLDNRAAVLNSIFKGHAEPFVSTNGTLHSNKGTFLIDCAYGGYCLHRLVNDSGAVRDVFNCGHIPARQLFDLMGAYLTGAYDGQKIPA